MDSNDTFEIPFKKCIIGQNEFIPVEKLVMQNRTCSFTVAIMERSFDFFFALDQISTMKQNYAHGDNYLLFKFRPSLMSQLRESLPEGIEYKWNSKFNKESRFIIQLDDVLEQQEEVILSNFFSSVTPLLEGDLEENIPETLVMSVKNMEELGFNLRDPAEQMRVLKKIEPYKTDIIDVDHLQPVTKKSKLHLPISDNESIDATSGYKHSDELKPTRSLRSRTQKSPLKYYESLTSDSIDDIVFEDHLKSFMESTRLPDNSSDPDCNMNNDKAEPCSNPCDELEQYDKTLLILQYPDLDGITIHLEDYLCLRRKELLNNVIIDFYLQYIFNERLTPEQQVRTHIYQSHFYSLYATSSNYNGWKVDNNKELKAVEKRYERVRDLPDNNVNIFEKDFIVIPINDNEHWYLAIVCFPLLDGAYTIDGDELVSEEQSRRDKRLEFQPPLRNPCLLIFDSVRGHQTRRTVASRHIKHFLESEWKAKYQNSFQFMKYKLVTNCPRCPQQSNATDCGLFLLEFMERFFVSSPVTDFRIPMDMANWFDPQIIKHKRKEIANDIQMLMERCGFADLIDELPSLSLKKAATVNDENVVDNNNHEEYNNNNDYNMTDNNNDGSVSFNNEAVSDVPTDNAKVSKDSTPSAEDPSDRKVNVSPDREINASPDREINATSDREMDATPDREINATPDREMDATPDREMKVTPDREMDATLDREMKATPDREMNANPDREMDAIPEHFGLCIKTEDEDKMEVVMKLTSTEEVKIEESSSQTHDVSSLEVPVVQDIESNDLVENQNLESKVLQNI